MRPDRRETERSARFADAVNAASATAPVGSLLAPRDDVSPLAVEDFELAFARLAWARTAHCPLVPEQQDALQWHLAQCNAALAALSTDASGPAGSVLPPPSAALRSVEPR